MREDGDDIKREGAYACRDGGSIKAYRACRPSSSAPDTSTSPKVRLNGSTIARAAARDDAKLETLLEGAWKRDLISSRPIPSSIHL